MYAQDSELEMARFGAGRRIGDCLVKGCAVFTGVIQSLGPMEKEPGEEDEERAVMTRTVEFKVLEWLYKEPVPKKPVQGDGQASGQTNAQTNGQSNGKTNGQANGQANEHADKQPDDPGSEPVDESVVHLLYAKRPELTKTSLGPWIPWEGVSLHVGAQLLVVRWGKAAPRSSWMGKPDDVALVVSDESLFAGIREAIALHQKFELDPEQAATIPEMLRGKPDSLITGYLLTYLMGRESVRNVDRAAQLLSEAMGDESIPGPGRVAVAEWLASSFSRLAEATRKPVAEALIASAISNDASIANSTLIVLMRLVDSQALNIKPFLTGESQPKIVESYRAFRSQSKSRQEHPEFEAQIGLR